MTIPGTIRILLVEDNPGDVRLLREYLAEAGAGRFQLTHVDRLSSGLECLAGAGFDAVLLDLSLPDSEGPATLVRVHAAAGEVPLVVLTGVEDEALGMRLVQAGAQDYLVKGQVTGPLLRRSLHYAVERKRVEGVIRESEERFRSIMDNSPSMIFLKDMEGRYLQVNRKFEDSFHVADRDIAGKTDEEIFPPEQAAAFRANDRKVFDYVAPMEFEEVVHHDDGPHTSLVLKFPLRDAQGHCYALCGIATDITERIKAEDQLQDTVDRVRTLSQRLNVVREEERTKIARELHDELGVRLTCSKLDLARLQSLMRESMFPREKMEEKIRSMIAEVDSTIASVQRLVAELRPGILDDLGLVAAIEWQCQDFERRSGIRCCCEAREGDIHLDGPRATAAFRICQEALTNVARHAKATSIRVLVEQVNGDLLLEIQDNGLGIPVEKLTDSASLGLLGMRERTASLGGQIEIAGRPGKGTTVILRLPCSEQADKLTRKQADR
jgi:two-component system sensor histidine kinase UhpB